MTNPELLEIVTEYVNANISNFHNSRLEALKKVQIKKLVARKNPYLFRAKNMNVSHDIVKAYLDAHLSSSEETMFGEWLEQLAIFISEKTSGGRKSGITGIDLEFDHEGIRYIISIKSGPHWGNSSQIKKMIADFKNAKKTLQTNKSNLIVQPVNGCCYGRDDKPNKGDYLKYCGQVFWEFISGNPNLYTDIIEPLGVNAKLRNEEFSIRYDALLNQMTAEFTSLFCNENGNINWDQMLKYNSGKEKRTLPSRKK